MEIKDQFLSRGCFKVNSGNQARFWEDVWVGEEPLMTVYPSLYNIARKRNVTVSSVLRSVPLNMSFRRALTGRNLDYWLQLVESIVNVELNDEVDVFVWKGNRTGRFTVQSLYKILMKQDRVPQNFVFWKVKLPCKIKIFLWYLHKGVTLTKDNLVKRNWKGSTKCCFCSREETIQHLMFDCHLARAIWGVVHVTFGVDHPSDFGHMCGTWLDNWDSKGSRLCLIGVAALLWSIWLSRNEVVFNKCSPKSFVQIIFRGTFWARSWAALSKEEDGSILKRWCQKLEITTMEIFSHFGWTARRRIED
jgi:hypothetical protein